MATILQKAVKKVTDVISPDEEPIIYFIDEGALETWDRDTRPIIEAGNLAIHAYQRVTGFKIETLEGLTELCEKPEAFYKDQFYKTNEKDFEHLTKLKLDFASMIPVPEEFNEVVSACNKFKRQFENRKPEYFTIEDDKLALTAAAYERRNRNAYLTAISREEKERLKICNDVIAAIEQLEPLLRNQDSMQDAINRKLYFCPLPYFLKIVNTRESSKVIPNPMFVQEGFAGSTHLGRYIPTGIERKFARKDSMPKLGEKYRKIQRVDVNGMPMNDHILCKEEDLDKHRMGPFRVRKNIILDGYFNEDGAPWGTPLKPKSYSTPSLSDRMISNFK